MPDALSRNLTSDPSKPVDLLFPYATVGSLNLRHQPLVISEDKEQLQLLQQADQVISSLYTDLGSGSCVDSSDFCIQDGLLYFMDKRVFCQLLPHKELHFYVPEALWDTLLGYFHGHPMAGHPMAGHLSIAKTLGHFQKQVYWPGMQREVKK